MNVKGIVSIFTYGFEKAKENFEDANCEYISLCDFENLLLQAFKNKLYYRSRTSLYYKNGEKTLLNGINRIMATFSGPEVLVENLTAEQLFDKLSNLTNLKEIIPSNIDVLKLLKTHVLLK